MDFSVCSQCGIEIEGKGIHYRDRAFCSDECCEEFEAEFIASDEPLLDELDGDLDDDLDDDLDEVADTDFDDDDLGYVDSNVKAKKDLLDDDFDINPEDF